MLQGSAPVAETCLVRSREAIWSLTTSEAEPVFPVPPSVEVIAVVVLFLVPATAPVTVTLKEQMLFAASDPPENVSKLPLLITRLPLPHREVVVPLAAVRPAGKVSVNPIPESESYKLGLLIVNVRVEAFLVNIEVGEKDLARTGGTITVKAAVA